MKSIDEMGYQELLAMEKQIQARIEEKRRQSLKNLTQKLQEIVVDAGFTMADVLSEFTHTIHPLKRGAGKTTVRTPAQPKYRNPHNAEQTWTGRGKRPNWFNSAISNGTSAESMLIV
jgi:DNA-binding protein H-NS